MTKPLTMSVPYEQHIRDAVLMAHPQDKGVFSHLGWCARLLQELDALRAAVADRDKCLLIVEGQRDALRAAQSATGKVERPTRSDVIDQLAYFYDGPMRDETGAQADYVLSLLATAEAAASARERAAVARWLRALKTHSTGLLFEGMAEQIERGEHQAGEEKP